MVTPPPVSRRIIGIRHRIKQTAENKAQPTQVFITSEGKGRSIKLDDENAELDFVLGRFPTKWRQAIADDDLSKFPPHHITWREGKKEEDLSAVAKNLIIAKGKKTYIAEEVAAEYEGFRAGDTVAMILGGSGDLLAYALARQAVKAGASKVMRLPPFALKNEREVISGDKNDDSELIATLVATKPELFYEVRSRDEQLILVREWLRLRTSGMKDRIACEQRVHQLFIGRAFVEAGLCPEGLTEKAFESMKANDVILQNLIRAEKNAADKLTAVVEGLDVYNQVFAPITGCGVMTSSRIISAVIDIRRFPTKAKLKAFCGVHVLADGTFPRSRTGAKCSWQRDARQAFYLLGEQFNKRPASEWGQKLLAYKAQMRKVHPNPIVVTAEGNVYDLIEGKWSYTQKNSTYTITVADNSQVAVKGKRRYSDGHILKMALWRTLTKLAEHFWREWWKMEDPARFAQPAPNTPSDTSSSNPVLSKTSSTSDETVADAA